MITDYISLVKENIERFQPSSGDLPVVLVGGGGPLLINKMYYKYGELIQPEGYQMSNAIGACYAPVSAELDQVIWLGNHQIDTVIEAAIEKVFRLAEKKGAKKETIYLSLREEYPFAYLKGEVIRLRLKAIGELAL